MCILDLRKMPRTCRCLRVGIAGCCVHIGRASSGMMPQICRFCSHDRTCTGSFPQIPVTFGLGCCCCAKSCHCCVVALGCCANWGLSCCCCYYCANSGLSCYCCCC